MTPAKVYKWTWFASMTYSVYAIRQYPVMAERIKQATNGQLDIRVLVGGEHPYKGADLPEAVRSGAAQMAEITPGYISGVEPTMMALQLPLLPPAAWEDQYKLHEAMHDKLHVPVWNRWNLTELTMFLLPPHQIYTKGKPVVAEDSLAGVKMRAWATEVGYYLGMFGATSQFVAWADCPTALATGLIQGDSTNAGSAYDAGYFDYLDTITIWNSLRPDVYAAVSNEALNELPQDIRNTFLKIMKDAGLEMTRGGELDGAMGVIKAVQNKQAKVYAPTADFRAKMVKKAETAVWDKWASATPKGPEILKEVKSVLETMKK